MAEERTDCDVLVVGGGMAGLAAAATAAEAGARVVVVEKSDTLGGSAVLSAGILWTAPDFDTWRANVPLADPTLGRTLVEGFGEAVAYVRATGVEVAPLSHGHCGFGSGHQIDVIGFVDRLRARVESSGGHIVRRSAGRTLLRRHEGPVEGAVLSGSDGPVEIRAGAVVLASGGFHGDAELRARYYGRHADEMLVRSNPGSVGDGLRMGTGVGAATSIGMTGFYGHLLPKPIVGFSERHFLPLTQYHSNRCLLVNVLGRRFLDESRGDEEAVQEVLRQPSAEAVLLADETTRQRYVIAAPYPYGEVVDRFAESVAAGADYLRADTLDALVAGLARWGVPAANLRATLDGYAAASLGEPAQVDAPLPAVPTPLVDPPFHALRVQPAITMPDGGLRIDADTRVLDRDGAPIPGLHAAGADAGGVHNVAYAGGLATALVFGRRAGRAATGGAR